MISDIGKSFGSAFGIDDEFDSKLNLFYTSSEWKKTRLIVIESVKLTNSYCCKVCESTIKLCVDHIKPLRYFWDLRLDINNLQILCDECNLEKSSIIEWSLTEHRQKKRQKREIDQYTNYITNVRQERKLACQGMNLDSSNRFLNSYSLYSKYCKINNVVSLSMIEYRKMINDRFDYDWNHRCESIFQDRITKILDPNII